jgi:hypothetical protein
MRILYCNKYNFGFSGTETYLFETMELMRARGHEVALFSMATTLSRTLTSSANEMQSAKRAWDFALSTLSKRGARSAR